MKTSDNNRINMLTTTQAVIEKYKDTWKDHEAFSESVDALTETADSIRAQLQAAELNQGAADVKDQALQALAKSVTEVIGATLAFAKKSGDPQLAAKVDFSPSDVVAGKAAQVVTRCTAICDAANEVAASLTKYGITAAKLTALKKKIDAFDAVRIAPRQSQVERSAANVLVTQFVTEALRILRDELDGLMVQFQEASAGFYAEYFAARVIVDSAASHAENPKPAPQPAPAPTA